MNTLSFCGEEKNVHRSERLEGVIMVMFLSFIPLIL